MDHMDTRLKELFGTSKTVVLLGEAGSGKSEVGLSLAEMLAAEYPGIAVEMFDLDQTKPLFRSRDILEHNTGLPFVLHYQKQLMDSPVLVSGVEDAMLAPDRRVLLDIGGGAHGVQFLGQFEELLNANETLVLYLINPYRPWSGNREDFLATRDEIRHISGLNDLCFAANPNHGPDTEFTDITEGLRRIRENLGVEPEFLCTLEEFADGARAVTGLPVLPLRIRLATSRVELMNEL